VTARTDVPVLDRSRESWVAETVEALRYLGCAVVPRVLDAAFLDDTRAAMYRVRDAIRADVGEERLSRAGELGVLRLMLAYDPHFLAFLEHPDILAVVDATVSETAILHLQNGLVLPPAGASGSPKVFQTTFHRDFPRHLGGYLGSVNVMVAVDEFTVENGGTLLVPGTHQLREKPSDEYLERHALPAECPAGSLLVFDSTLWHAAGANNSERDRLAINHQFTRSFLKQQVDYVRALGDSTVLAQPPRTQQLLGWYTRVVTSLDEFYRPTEERLYRSGQG
jgi:ectoine hydroxylase-related dioxygenase (phytanoyl-CoA dioxygenase family)